MIRQTMAAVVLSLLVTIVSPQFHIFEAQPTLYCACHVQPQRTIIAYFFHLPSVLTPVALSSAQRRCIALNTAAIPPLHIQISRAMSLLRDRQSSLGARREKNRCDGHM